MSLKNEILSLSSRNVSLVMGISSSLTSISSTTSTTLKGVQGVASVLGRVVDKLDDIFFKVLDAIRGAGTAAQKAGQALSKLEIVLEVIQAILAALNLIAAAAILLQLDELKNRINKLQTSVDNTYAFITRTMFSLRDEVRGGFAALTQWVNGIDQKVQGIQAYLLNTIAPALVQLGLNVAEIYRTVLQEGIMTRGFVDDRYRQLGGIIEAAKTGILSAVNGVGQRVESKIDRATASITNAITNNPTLSQVLGKTREIGDSLGQLGTIAGAAAAGAAGTLVIQGILSRPMATACRFAADPFTPAINTAVTATVVPNVIQTTRNTQTLLTRVGGQVAGGISGFLTRLANNTLVDKAINLANLVTNLHNAYWLSNGLTQTLFSAISNSMAVFGVRDVDGNPIDVGAIVGNKLDEMTKAVLGVETVDGIKAGWAKYSRIYQAASNIVWSIQSIGYSIQEVLEVTGEWIARIGNSLRRDGVVRENAFQWMNEDLVTARPGQLGQIQRVIDGLEEIENVVSQVDQVAQEVLSIQETVTQLGTQSQEFKAAIVDALPPDPPRPDNIPIKTTQEQNKADSQSPDITPADLAPGAP